MAGQLASHDKCDLSMVDPASSREDLESKRRVVRACLYCRFRYVASCCCIKCLCTIPQKDSVLWA
jgi:hypothetical protein